MFASMQNDVYTKYAGPTSFNTQSLLLNSIMVEVSFRASDLNDFDNIIYV